MKKVLIIHASAGAGHRKAAEALKSSFSANPAQDLEVTLIDALDYTKNIFKKSYARVYIFLVTYVPFIWGIIFHFLNCELLMPVIRPIRFFFNAYYGKQLIEYVVKLQPDIIISEHFMAAQLMANLKLKKRINSTVVCGVTDFGVHAFWINPGTDYYLVASDLTRDEIINKGVKPEQVFVTGIPVEGKFSQTPDREGLFKKLELEPHKLTVLVASGGFGVGPIKEIISGLDQIETDLQIVVICGKNKILFEDFKKETFIKKVNVFGYVHNMDEFMEVADLIVTKSGGLTVSESLAKGLPMLIIKPIPGQETRNAQVMEKYNTGIRLNNVKMIGKEVGLLLENNQKLLIEMKANTKKIAKPNASDRICQWVKSDLLKMN
ncbi:MAG: glycosyltransferase [Candidatus Omnitrophota bacterium]